MKGMNNYMFLKHKVYGSDYKTLPLKVAVYTNCASHSSDEYIRSKTASIKRYIKKKTSWEIVGYYESSWENGEFSQTGLQELINDSCTDKFDIIVTRDPGEISMDTILIEEIIQANLLEELSHEIFLSKWDEIDEKKRLFFEKF